MNRMLALLATALAPFCFGACSPYDSIAQIPPHPVHNSAEEAAAPSHLATDLAVWPLGVAP